MRPREKCLFCANYLSRIGLSSLWLGELATTGVWEEARKVVDEIKREVKDAFSMRCLPESSYKEASKHLDALERSLKLKGGIRPTLEVVHDVTINLSSAVEAISKGISERICEGGG